MLIDEADYSKVGGDSYLSGYVKGFEVVPFPYLTNVTGLPEEVGQTYSGDTLFTNVDGEYVANYKESLLILESLFPKDKIIFLMCGGGGYAGMCKKMLVSLGWDENKIFNVGGYWYYEGKNAVSTTYVKDGETYYDFSKVNYHPIEFNALHKINDENKDKENVNNENIFTNLKDINALNELENNGNTFLLYVYLPGCTSCAKFLPEVEALVREDKLKVYSISLKDAFNTNNSVKDRIEYSPSMFIYKDGEVLAYLNPQSDADLPYYESKENLLNWIKEKIELDELVDDCETGCTLK
jgi:hypothetical protein